MNIGNAKDPLYGDIYTRNAGNASALMALRDVKMFDESKLSDGYAGLMAQIGTRTQSASYAAELSNSIASNLEADRTAVSGVNLDEEAARLIQYQQAYQASAKMLQIAQNIFDNLIQSMGRLDEDQPPERLCRFPLLSRRYALREGGRRQRGGAALARRPSPGLRQLHGSWVARSAMSHR